MSEIQDTCFKLRSILSRRAWELVQKYHKDQTDCGGQPYINHLGEVASKVERLYQQECANNPKNTERDVFYLKAIIVAILHDILEDTECTTTVLFDEGFDEEIIDAVVAITRKKNEQYYFDFIERVSKNPIAKIVKICDLENNMDIRRLNKFGDYEMKRLKKYWHCWKFLKGELTADEVNKAIHPNRSC